MNEMMINKLTRRGVGLGLAGLLLIAAAAMAAEDNALAKTPAEIKADELIEEKTKDTKVQAGFFSLFKEESGRQWEPWVVYHKGRYYNFTDASREGAWNVHALGVSDDGVYWKEYGRLQTVDQLTPGASLAEPIQCTGSMRRDPGSCSIRRPTFPIRKQGRSCAISALTWLNPTTCFTGNR